MDIISTLQSALQPYHKGRSGQQDRYSCPWRNGSDGQTLAVNWADGKWYDHKEQSGGSLASLASRLGIQTEGRESVPSTKRKYSGLDDYARAHGVTEDYLLQFGWTESRHQSRPCIVYPTTKDDGKRGGWRYRFIDGNQPKYTSEPGYKPVLYGFGGKMIEWMITANRLILVNGEISTITAHYHQIPSFCITSGEKARLPEHLIEALKQWTMGVDLEIVVAFDCDDAGFKAGQGIANHLKEIGYRAKAVDLGLTDGGDFSDFCMLYGEDALLQLDRCKVISASSASTSRRDRYIYIPFAEMANLPKATWLVPNLIQEHAINVIYGQSGSGKTFYAIHLALTIAQHSRVVYVAGEGTTGLFHRGLAWCQHNGGHYNNLDMALGSVAFMDETEFAGFRDKCESNGAKTIFIDTLARSMTGADENSTRDMSIFIDRCDTLVRDLNATVIIIHHTGKMGFSERGSSVLRASCDMMHAVAKSDDEIVVTCAKAKDSEPFMPMTFTLLNVKINQSGLFCEAPVLIEYTPPAEGESLANDMTAERRQVLDVVAQQGSATFAEVHEFMPDKAKSAVSKMLTKLKDSGYIAQDGMRQPYTITDKGREIVQGKPKNAISEFPVFPEFPSSPPPVSSSPPPVHHPVKTSSPVNTGNTGNSTLQTLQTHQSSLFASDEAVFVQHWEPVNGRK